MLSRVIVECSKKTKFPSNVIYKNIRFESYKAEKNKYSFIYNSHTLEHFKSPFSMLKKML